MTNGKPEPALCETCAAFIKVHEDPQLGKVGECALEVFRPPLRAASTCTRHRPKGAASAVARPRAAGEPRRGGNVGRGGGRSVFDSGSAVRTDGSVSLPQEIDIDMDIDEFRRVLREVISDELGISRPELGQRWQGGEVVLKPGKEGTQEKRIPVEAFFHKIVMVRDKLRLLEAKVNSHAQLSDEDKVQLQAYITGCYGSLTTFNLLFSEKQDQFSGAASKDD